MKKDILKRLQKATKEKKKLKISDELKQKVKKSLSKRENKSEKKKTKKEGKRSKPDITKIAEGSKCLKVPKIKKAIESWRLNLLKADLMR